MVDLAGSFCIERYVGFDCKRFEQAEASLSLGLEIRPLGDSILSSIRLQRGE
jgi:hypothetical protein